MQGNLRIKCFVTSYGGMEISQVLLFLTKKQKTEVRELFVVEISLILWYDASTTIGRSAFKLRGVEPR